MLIMSTLFRAAHLYSYMTYRRCSWLPQPLPLSLTSIILCSLAACIHIKPPTAVSQSHLRATCVYLDVKLLNHPHYILLNRFAPPYNTAFDAKTGEVTDPVSTHKGEGGEAGHSVAVSCKNNQNAKTTKTPIHVPHAAQEA